MAITDFKPNGVQPNYAVSPALAAPVSNRKLLSFDQCKRADEPSLDDLLSTAILASDSELNAVLGQIDQISLALKTDRTDTAAVRVASHPAVWSAVRQTLVERELRRLALTDELTCLYNRRAFLAAASHQLKLAVRKKQNLMLFFCDVDGLKAINDSFGHREGDLALIHAADALEQTFRGSDILARLGGDEFAVLAVEASSQNQDLICQRLERRLKKVHENERRYRLSISVGAARFDPKQPLPLGNLMAQADSAMYQRKRSRNKH